MPNNENLSNFIDQKAWTDFERLEKVINSAAESMEFLSLTAKDAFNGLNNATTLKQLVDLMNKAAAAGTGMGDTLPKLKRGLKELTEEQIKANMSIKERNDLLKMQVAAEVAPAGSIAKVRAEAALLRVELSKLNLEKEKGRQQDIKNQLAEKDTFIKTNVDAYTAQKINIGNYPGYIHEMQSIKTELDALAASGQKDSVEFERLTAKMGEYSDALGRARQQIGFVQHGIQALNEENSKLDSGLVKDSASVNNFTDKLVTAKTQIGFVTSAMTQIVGQMEVLKEEGRENTAEFRLLEEEFKKLAIRGAELKEQLAGIGIAIKEAGAAGERGVMVMEKFAESMKEIAHFALVFFGVQAGLEFIAGISEEFEKADKAARMLKNTLDNVGSSNLFAKLTKESEEFAEKFNYLDTYEVQDVFTKLITYGKLTEEQIKEALPVVIDFAAKTGKNLSESTDLITASLEGSARGLKQFGINIKEAKTATGEALPPAERFNFIMEQLKPRVEGAANAFKNGWAGTVEAWKKNIREIELSIADFFMKIAGFDEAQQKAAVSAKKEATEGQKLVDQYEELSKKVEKTSEDKKMLGDITSKLGNIFGNSVLSINEETHSLELNMEATKDLIKQKLLLSNQRASEAAAKYNAAKEDAEMAEKQLEIDKKRYNDVPGGMPGGSKYLEGLSVGQRVPGGQQGIGIVLNYLDELAKLEDANKRIKKSLDDLKELGFDKETVDKLFAPGELDPGKNIPTPPGGKKETDDIIAKQKDLSAKVFAEYKIRIEQSAATNKIIADNESNSYEMRLENFKEYQRKQNELKLNELANKYGDSQFSISHLKQKPNQSDASFATEKKSELQELHNIELQYNALQIQNTRENNAELKKFDSDYVDYRLANVKLVDAVFDEEQAKIKGRRTEEYNSGRMSKEDYDNWLKAANYAFEQVKLATHRATLEKMIEMDKAAGVDADSIKKEEAALQSVINQQGNLAPKNRDGKKLENLGLSPEEFAQAQDIASNIMSLEQEVMKVVDMRYQSEIDALEKKKELIDQNYDSEINSINGSFESEAKKHAAIKILNQEKMAADKQIHDQEVALKRKMAIADRAAAVLNAVEQGVVAEVGALKYLDNPVTAPLYPLIAGLIGGITAAQIGLILGTPLPQYGQGVEDHPGGPAIVGELNKPEYVFEPGKPVQMVQRATKMNLAKHTRVVTEENLLRDSQGILANELTGANQIINMGVEMVIKQEMQGLRSDIGELQETVKNKKETHFHWDNGQLRKTVKQGTSWTTYLNDNFN